MRVTKPRKPSSQVHKKTIQQRTHTILAFREHIIGEDDMSRSVHNYVAVTMCVGGGGEAK